MDGYELCRKMRADKKFRDTVFIAQTGWGQAEHRRRSREAGFDHHLVKPVDMQVLQQLLQDINSPRQPKDKNKSGTA
jgi:CheY-like chemotaxis protein